MHSPDLTLQVSAAVAARNPPAHVDRERLVARVVTTLATDPVYVAALAQARTVNAGLAELVAIVDRAVKAELAAG